MIAPGHEETLHQFRDANPLFARELLPKGERLLAQVQMNALDVHAHKLAIVGLCVKMLLAASVGALKTRRVGTTVLTRHSRCRCSSEERGKRSPRLGNAQCQDRPNVF